MDDIMSRAGAAGGAGEVEVGHNGLLGTREAPIAGRARTEVVGTSIVMGSPVKMGNFVPT